MKCRKDFCDGRLGGGWQLISPERKREVEGFKKITFNLGVKVRHHSFNDLSWWDGA